MATQTGLGVHGDITTLSKLLDGMVLRQPTDGRVSSDDTIMLAECKDELKKSDIVAI